MAAYGCARRGKGSVNHSGLADKLSKMIPFEVGMTLESSGGRGVTSGILKTR